MDSKNSYLDARKEKIKVIQQINKERPCKECIHYRQVGLVHCRLAAGNCNFNHSEFKPFSQKSKTK